MAKAIFKVFFKIIVTLTNVILTPINLVVANLFPDLSQVLIKFNYAASEFLGNGLTWFWSLIPSGCKTIIIIYITILISYYTISVTVHVILKVYTIIKNIKIWQATLKTTALVVIRS